MKRVYDKCKNCKHYEDEHTITVHGDDVEYEYFAVKCNKKNVYALSFYELEDGNVFESNELDIDDDRIVYAYNNCICVDYSKSEK